MSIYTELGSAAEKYPVIRTEKTLLGTTAFILNVRSVKHLGEKHKEQGMSRVKVLCVLFRFMLKLSKDNRNLKLMTTMCRLNRDHSYAITAVSKD